MMHLQNLNQSTSFLVEAFPLTPGLNDSTMKYKYWPRVRVGTDCPKFFPNDEKHEK